MRGRAAGHMIGVVMHRPDAARQRFEAIVGRVYEPLQRYARRRVHPDDVDDIVAETLLVLWRRLEEAPAGHELAWCYGVARRCVANLRRSRDRRSRLADRLADQARAQAADEAASARPAPRRGPDTDVLDDVLDQLPEADAELLLLWAWEDLSARDLGHALGISTNAATLRLFRARRRAAALLGRQRHDLPGGGHTPDASTGERRR